ncbi:DUF6346 domain-containing protein [Actinoplanes regularis]|uniref:DUF3592 domain-containing protein n=1 Tax=Actinoplanes regularis TaxID=52697 RepID=A0A239D2I2_9ACTN|nr:DUF6346 domain-containing protein [Actinoplanes regularis]GIE88453.1 hypothetical protein Are01nite_49330 [Actinoplanes regularis]SNS26228.1 hypothetical protein SAMN06264365_112214 [Actinoplanes regularis]
MKRFLLSLVLLLAAGALGLLVPTVARNSQPDFAKAEQVGTGIVSACSEQGPVTLGGFGYTSKCQLDVTWQDGSRHFVDPDRYGFADFAEIGKTITVGDLGDGEYARPDRPFRPLVVASAWALAILAVAALVTGVLGVRRVIREHVDFT